MEKANNSELHAHQLVGYIMTDKVDWLYKAPTQDREEYLLGRKIDKFVDPTLEEQASCNPVSWLI